VEVYDIGISLLPLVKEYAVKLAEGKRDAKWFIVDYESAGNCFLLVYYSLAKLKEITRIEDLEQQEKTRLWQMSGKLRSGKTERTEVCRILHCMEELTQTKIYL
jgi:LEA14-like dessication related protein